MSEKFLNFVLLSALAVAILDIVHGYKVWRPSCEISGCTEGYFCMNGQCRDRCITMRCISDTCCSQGKCHYKNITCDKVCPEGQECRISDTCPPEQQCRPLLDCSTILCISGTSCVDNQCLPNTCTDTTCKAGEECILQPSNATYPELAVCVPVQAQPCDGVQCDPGEKCFPVEVQCIKAPCLPVGICKPDPCAGVHCNNPEVCKDGRCVLYSRPKGFYM